MSVYPGYPDNRLIVGGVDLTTNFRMVLLDGYVLSPPEPKYYMVNVPGGNGVIDLTEALAGDVMFEQRQQDFYFKIIFPNDFENIKTKLSNFLHGKEFDYKITMDPNYTYHGRFKVAAYDHYGYFADGVLADIHIHVDANPYKTLPTHVYRLNAAAGKWYYFPSGRMPVRPVIETLQPTLVRFGKETYQVGVGTFRLNKVLFKEGVNALYLNTYQIYNTHWQDFGRGGQFERTWAEAGEMTWDEMQALAVEGITRGYNWFEMGEKRWDEYKAAGTRWNDLTFTPEASESEAYFTYEWGDL